MLYFDINPRDGGPIGGCHSCCCQPMALTAGEQALITLNYAPWSVPIGSPGIIDGIEIELEVNDEGCSSNAINGFLPPKAANLSITTLADTAVAIDLGPLMTPSTNTYSYRTVRFASPKMGTLNQVGTAGGSTFSYTPYAGYAGYDYFSYEATDAQGRTTIGHVQISVGTHRNQPELHRMATAPFIDLASVRTNKAAQTVQIPIYMPTNCEPCVRYKLSILQKAQNCECDTFTHISCFDIVCKDC